MDTDHRSGRGRHILWVYPESPLNKLDSATWLDVTKSLRALGWSVTLVVAGSGGRQSIRGVEMTCIPRPERYVLRQVVFHLKMLRLLDQSWDAVDAVLFHYMSAPWFLPVRIRRALAGVDRPLLVMDTRTVPMPQSRWRDQLRATYHVLINRLANRWVDGQTAITRRMAASVGMPPDQLWGIWPSGVDIERFGLAKAGRRWPLPGEPVVLTYVGLLNSERNLMSLCRAVVKASSEGMAFNLILIGEGQDRGRLEEFALRFPGLIRVEHPVPHDQVPHALSQSHVGVLPFPDLEKFRVSSPIKLFEYMGAGLPLLATKIVSHTDVVTDDDYVFWAHDGSVDGLYQALCSIWAARPQLERMGSAAADAAKEWTWTASAKKLSKALEHGLSLSSESTASPISNTVSKV